MHMQPEKKLARITGLLYLVIFVCAGFAEGYVRAGLIVPGDPIATAVNIGESGMLFRMGFVGDLVAFMCDTAIAVLLYELLRPAGRTLALVAAAFRLVAHPAIAAVNLLNHFAALLLVNGSESISAFTSGQTDTLAMFFLDIQHTGYLLAGAFFGLHCLLLGVLLIRSDRFPGVLGVLMVIASFGYLIESFGNFLFPAHETVYAWIVGVTAVVGELSLALWLLIKGVRDSTQPEPAV